MMVVGEKRGGDDERQWMRGASGQERERKKKELPGDQGQRKLQHDSDCLALLGTVLLQRSAERRVAEWMEKRDIGPQ